MMRSSGSDRNFKIDGIPAKKRNKPLVPIVVSLLIAAIILFCIFGGAKFGISLDMRVVIAVVILLQAFLFAYAYLMHRRRMSELRMRALHLGLDYAPKGEVRLIRDRLLLPAEATALASKIPTKIARFLEGLREVPVRPVVLSLLRRRDFR